MKVRKAADAVITASSLDLCKKKNNETDFGVSFMLLSGLVGQFAESCWQRWAARVVFPQPALAETHSMDEYGAAFHALNAWCFEIHGQAFGDWLST